MDYTVCLEALKQNKNAINAVPKIYQEKLKYYLNEINKQISENVYQQIFSEIRSIFPEKELFLKL